MTNTRVVMVDKFCLVTDLVQSNEAQFLHYNMSSARIIYAVVLQRKNKSLNSSQLPIVYFCDIIIVFLFQVWAYHDSSWYLQTEATQQDWWQVWVCQGEERRNCHEALQHLVGCRGGTYSRSCWWNSSCKFFLVKIID